jgi:hypothetical protein
MFARVALALVKSVSSRSPKRPIREARGGIHDGEDAEHAACRQSVVHEVHRAALMRARRRPKAHALDRLPAVDDHRMANNESGGVGAKPDNGRGDLVGLSIRPTGSCAITLSRPSAVPPLKRSIIAVWINAGAPR